MESTPFYRIMLSNPKGLDELWRIEKVMHPDNIKASRYVLFEEILPDRSLEDILLSPQKEPYYEPVDTIHDDPGPDDEYLAIAAELNKDIPIFSQKQDRCRASRAAKGCKEWLFVRKAFAEHEAAESKAFSRSRWSGCRGCRGRRRFYGWS